MANKVVIETDEEHEAAQALAMCREQLEKTSSDFYAWKWAIIALHNSIQNFIVCAISGSAQIGALRKEKHKKEWLKAWQERREPPDVELAAFLKLYQRMKSETNFTADIDKDIESLNHLRNNFTHFTPTRWTMHIEGLPGIFLNCLKVIEHLWWESGKMKWLKDQNKERAQDSLRACEAILQRLDKEYNGRISTIE